MWYIELYNTNAMSKKTSKGYSNAYSLLAKAWLNQMFTLFMLFVLPYKHNTDTSKSFHSDDTNTYLYKHKDTHNYVYTNRFKSTYYLHYTYLLSIVPVHATRKYLHQNLPGTQFWPRNLPDIQLLRPAAFIKLHCSHSCHWKVIHRVI